MTKCKRSWALARHCCKAVSLRWWYFSAIHCQHWNWCWRVEWDHFNWYKHSAYSPKTYYNIHAWWYGCRSSTGGYRWRGRHTIYFISSKKISSLAAILKTGDEISWWSCFCWGIWLWWRASIILKDSWWGGRRGIKISWRLHHQKIHCHQFPPQLIWQIWYLLRPQSDWKWNNLHMN